MPLTTATNIKDRCSGKKRHEDYILADYIEYGEETLKGVLGYDLLRKLQAGSLTSDYQTLLDDYVVPYLDWIVWEITIPSINNQIGEKGTHQFNGEGYEKGSQNSAMNTVKNMKEMKGMKLFEYLENNKSKFPEYKTPKVKNRMTWLGGY